MKSIGTIVVLFLFLMIMGMVNPSRVNACVCPISSIEERYEESDVVFLGTVVEADQKGGLFFDVNRYYKGWLTESYVLGNTGGMCGQEYTVGVQYLVFSDNDQGVETTDLCKGNKAAVYAGEELRYLNKLVDTKDDTITIVLVLLFGVFIYLGIRRLRK